MPSITSSRTGYQAQHFVLSLASWCDELMDLGERRKSQEVCFLTWSKLSWHMKDDYTSASPFHAKLSSWQTKSPLMRSQLSWPTHEVSSGLDSLVLGEAGLVTFGWRITAVCTKMHCFFLGDVTTVVLILDWFVISGHSSVVLFGNLYFFRSFLQRMFKSEACCKTASTFRCCAKKDVKRDT